MSSRVARIPVNIPKDVEVTKQSNNILIMKSKLGTHELAIPNQIAISIEADELSVSTNDNSRTANALSGTIRSLIHNNITGLITPFEKKLILIGVGYRAQVKGDVLNLSLGFSHPVQFDIPENIEIKMPTQTEIIISGTSKQEVGQVAADIKKIRPVEPYKGKGIRYSDERISLKETKK